jgi:hypothetical protein
MMMATLTAWARLATLAVVVGVAAAGPGSAQAPPRFDLKGACYCRASGDLTCSADLTERECTRRCREQLCDDWFWLEQRPCWNWGYGG